MLHCVMTIAVYLSIIAGLLFTSCQHKKNDNQSLRSSHQKKSVLLKGTDTGLNNMTAMLESTFYYTHCNNATTEKSDTSWIKWQQSATTDSSFNLFYNSLTLLRKEYDCLRSGNCQLVDETNAYVLAYTAKKNKEELLIILNFDEDNRALKADYQFMDMPLLLGNYENGAMTVLTTSLLLRPFEVRIYQVH
jgi:glycosidase